MRRTAAALALAAALMTSAAALHAQQREGQQMGTLPQAELDVVKVLLAQERAWNTGNMDAYATGYKNAPETLFIGRDVLRGYDGMLARYKATYPDRATMGRLSFMDLEPHLLDEKYAYVVGRFTVERDKKHGGNIDGVFNLLMEKTPDGWKIILDHTSS